MSNLPQRESPVPIESTDELNRLMISEALALKNRDDVAHKQLRSILTDWGLFLAGSPLVKWESLSKTSLDNLWPYAVETWKDGTEGFATLFSQGEQTTVQLSIFRTVNDKSMVFVDLSRTSPKSTTLASVAVTKAGITDAVRVSGMGVEEALLRPDLRGGNTLVTVLEMFKEIPFQISRKGFDPFSL